MSNLTSFQRKLVYVGGILLLLVPIVWLGQPPNATVQQSLKRPGETELRIDEGSGGKLSQLRQTYELGEVSLGDVDPTSSTMNLLLLGFRGIATSSLWMDAQEQQKRKEWAELDSTIKSIVLLQPHFLKVWHFQGWNLAYNVSAEWDAVADRYYWVKHGVKFYIEGKDRTKSSPIFTGSRVTPWGRRSAGPTNGSSSVNSSGMSPTRSSTPTASIPTSIPTGKTTTWWRVTGSSGPMMPRISTATGSTSWLSRCSGFILPAG